LINKNPKEFSACNIQQWHNLGYTGKDINVGNTEKASINSPLFNGKIHDPYGDFSYEECSNLHGNHTAIMVHAVAPDADIYCLDMSLSGTNDNLRGRLIDKTIPLIIEKNISVITSSSWTSLLAEKTSLVKKIKSLPVLISLAGNYGYSGVSGFAESGYWLAIGAVGFQYKSNEIFFHNYSARDEKLSFTCFSGLSLPDFRPEPIYKDKFITKNGTSFAAPMFAGMCALVQDFFLTHTGKLLTHFQMDKFVKDHLIDLGDVGWDDKYGFGLFVLPDPRNIIIDKYIDVAIVEVPEKEEIKMEFKDIGNHWAKQEIEFITDKGLMQGYPDETFQPDRALTRAEYATMKAKELGFVKKK